MADHQSKELPKPLSKLTWDNAVAISPTLAQERRLKNGDLVDISDGERRVRAAVWVLLGKPSARSRSISATGRNELGGSAPGSATTPIACVGRPNRGACAGSCCRPWNRR